MKFSAIVLSKSGDYLVEENSGIKRKDKGVELEDAYVFNEEEQAQQIKAEKIFIPYNAVETVQYGEFEQETV